MMQVQEHIKNIKREPGYNRFSVAVTVFLMLSFVGATMYVLISSLL